MNYKCPVCGNTEHHENAKFCMICGSKIESEDKSETEEEHQRTVKESVRRFVNGEISSKEHLKVLFGSKTFELWESGAVRL